MSEQLLQQQTNEPFTAQADRASTSSFMKKALFLVNPVAGRMLIKRYLAEVLNIFTQSGYLTTVYMTQRAGDATRMIAEHGSEYEAIFCSGGDGTLNEAITGMQQARLDLPLGYIPCGSTNVFADCVGLSSQPLKAARDIVSGSERLVDIASFNGYYFSYISAIGLFSSLSYTVPQSMKNAIGHAAYVLSAVQDLSKVRPMHLRITGSGDFLTPGTGSGKNKRATTAFTDHREGTLIDGDYLFAAISNCDTIASAFPLDKHLVDLNDGQFEFLLIQYPSSPLEMEEILAALASKSYTSCKYLQFFRFSQCEIFTDFTEPWSLDGEMGMGEPPVTVQVLHNGLRLLTSAK